VTSKNLKQNEDIMIFTPEEGPRRTIPTNQDPPKEPNHEDKETEEAMLLSGPSKTTMFENEEAT
jgi:hypothetical protein